MTGSTPSGDEVPSLRAIDFRATRVAVISLLVVALGLRIAAVMFASDFAPCCDAIDYIRHGRSIAEGRGYPPSVSTADHGPTAVRPPVYPYFLGAVFRISGNRLTAVRVAQAIVGTIAVGLLGLLAWQVFRRRSIALVALGLGAVYPPFVLFTTAIFSETVFLLLELATIAAAWQLRRDGERYRFAVIAGLLVGLSWLTREVGVFILVGVAAAILTAPALGRGLRWKRTIVVVAVAAATVAPWTVRNAVELHAFIPVGLQTGLQLAGVYNEESRTSANLVGAWRPPTTVQRDAPLFQEHGITEVDLDRKLKANALDYARAHPKYVVVAIVRNSLRMLQFGNAASQDLVRYNLNLSPRLVRVDRAAFYVAGLLALGGLFTLALRRVPWWFWLTPLVFFGVAAAAAGLVRYRIPVDPFVLLAGAPAVVALWDRARAASWASPARA